MKDTSVDKVRKTCGNCDKVDHRQGMCKKSGNFVNMSKGRPNCKNWKLGKVAVEGVEPIVPAAPSAEIQEQVKDLEKKVEAATGVPNGMMPGEAQSKPAPAVKDHPMRRFLKKIGIIQK